MKHYPREDWLFGEGTGPSETAGIWLAKSNQPGESFEIDFFQQGLEELIGDDDLMAFVIHFRRMKADAVHNTTQLLQKNQIDGNLENPHLLMEEEDASRYLTSFQEYQLSKDWLPILENEARRRGLVEELNSNVF